MKRVLLLVSLLVVNMAQADEPLTQAPLWSPLPPKGVSDWPGTAKFFSSMATTNFEDLVKRLQANDPAVKHRVQAVQEVGNAVGAVASVGDDKDWVSVKTNTDLSKLMAETKIKVTDLEIACRAVAFKGVDIRATVGGVYIVAPVQQDFKIGLNHSW